ncbi:MAG: phytanoyl-CoA dioxygenase family protein [Candidatus Binatia bacterium]|nr:phytanoyl-CoA dioxygenase family protein [Candidatus Binatia bacterium]
MELHLNNQLFRWEPHEGPFRRVTPAQARAYDEQGAFILEDAFDVDTMAKVIDIVDPIEARTTEFLRTQKDGKMFIAQADAITFTTHLVLQSPLLRDFVSGPVFQDLGHDLIGSAVRLYWDQAVYKKPEPDREFPWHQDNGYTYIEPQAYLTCWVALTDADEENGCPWVVPGKHLDGTLLHTMTDLGWRCLEDRPDAVPLPVRAGSIAVFSSLTPHRTGPNRTTDVRKSYIVQFAPDGANRIDVTPEGTRHRTPQDAPDRQFLIG